MNGAGRDQKGFQSIKMVLPYPWESSEEYDERRRNNVNKILNGKYR